MNSRVMIVRSDLRLTEDGEVYAVAGVPPGDALAREVTALVENDPDATECVVCGARVGWAWDCRADPERLEWRTMVVTGDRGGLCEECGDA